MPRKMISVTLVCSLFVMFSTLPVMALPVQDSSAVTGFFKLSRPLMSAELRSYADDAQIALESREAGGIESFLQYAGTLFLAISLMAIIGGIQLIVTGEDVGEGLIDILLGMMFLIYALMMLGSAPGDGLPEAEPE